MKCWKSAFNAQGWRLVIVTLQVGAVMEALKKMERQGETQFTTKKLRSPHPWMLTFYIFFESHPIYDQTQDSSVVFLTL